MPFRRSHFFKRLKLTTDYITNSQPHTIMYVVCAHLQERNTTHEYDYIEDRTQDSYIDFIEYPDRTRYVTSKCCQPHCKV